MSAIRQRAERPLFIPLKTIYFMAFRDGHKRDEYRLYGPRWNERTCAPGRPVVLSHGYSGARIAARIAKFERVVMTTETYGPDRELAAIRLTDLHSMDALTMEPDMLCKSSPPGDVIRKKRLAYGLTQQQCAEMIGYTLSGWQRFEQNERRMRPALYDLWIQKANQIALE